MSLFDPRNRGRSERHARIYALYEVALTASNFVAALLFVVGSALFFREATATAATWLFLVGSAFFTASPTIKLARELHLWRARRFEALARRVD